MLTFLLNYNAPEYKKFIAKLENAELTVSPEVIGSITENAALNTQKWSQESLIPHRKTGFTESSIIVYKLSETASTCVVNAEHGYSLEFGHRAKDGKWVNGIHFFTPNAYRAEKQMREEFKLLLKSIVTGVKFNYTISRKLGGKSNSGDTAKKRGVGRAHKYTERRLLADGTYSYRYGSQPTKFGFIKYLGLGKAQRQAGRKVRIGGRR